MNVVVLESYASTALARLHADQRLKASTEMSNLRMAEILLIRSRTKVDAALLDRAPKLKLVITSTSGFDHIDWRECQKRGIVAAHTPEANAQSTAELTMMLMLATERELIAARAKMCAEIPGAKVCAARLAFLGKSLA